MAHRIHEAYREIVFRMACHAAHIRYRETMFANCETFHLMADHWAHCEGHERW